VSQPSEMELRRAAGLFKVLGHPERIRIATRLADGRPHTQHDLLDEFPWAQSTLARHLGLMRTRGLITATRHGNEVHLRLADDLVPQLLELITTHDLVARGAERARPVVVGGVLS
jgi:DNA-binding transcriptional ArsR family regulator